MLQTKALEALIANLLAHLGDAWVVSPNDRIANGQYVGRLLPLLVEHHGALEEVFHAVDPDAIVLRPGSRPSFKRKLR